MLAIDTISGRITDSATGQPLSYVNIGITATGTGTVSDDSGAYHLSVSDSAHVVTFSYLGYATVHIKCARLLEQGDVQLSATNHKLQTVEINASRLESKPVVLGVRHKNGRGHSIAYSSVQLGAEIGAAISVKRPTYIQSANFVINHAQGDSMCFRVHLYSWIDGEVGENLLRENIYIKEKQKRGLLTVSLAEYNIVVEDDVLLSLEWLEDVNGLRNQEITFDTKKSRKLGGAYIKQYSNGGFERIRHIGSRKPCFYLVGKQIPQNK